MAKIRFTGPADLLNIHSSMPGRGPFGYHEPFDADGSFASLLFRAGPNCSAGSVTPGRVLPPPPPGAIPVDERSEKILATLRPEIIPYGRQLVLKAADAGITIKIISGLRTYEKQDDLYATGRTTGVLGKTVTNAKGGWSNHNFGLAFDIGVFTGEDSKNYLENSPDYETVGPLGVALGLDWGGNWIDKKDYPHYELRPPWAAGMSETNFLRGLRGRKASGKDLFAP